MAALCASQCGLYAEDQGILCVLLLLPHFQTFICFLQECCVDRLRGNVHLEENDIQGMLANMFTLIQADQKHICTSASLNHNWQLYGPLAPSKGIKNLQQHVLLKVTLGFS